MSRRPEPGTICASKSPERETELAKELLEFNRERRRIKSVIGNLGGKSYSRIDTLINVVFLVVIAVATKWLPVLVPLEIGVLLISIEIVWMIHSHFQDERHGQAGQEDREHDRRKRRGHREQGRETVSPCL